MTDHKRKECTQQTRHQNKYAVILQNELYASYQSKGLFPWTQMRATFICGDVLQCSADTVTSG